MNNLSKIVLAIVPLTVVSSHLFAQQLPTPQDAAAASVAASAKPKPEDTEVWSPEPRVVTPGAADSAPPSDAIVLFDGKNLDQWVSAQDKTPARWIVHDGVMTVNKAPGVGNIETKRAFKKLPTAY